MNKFLQLLTILFSFLIFSNSCTHEPVIPEVISVPQDTTPTTPPKPEWATPPDSALFPCDPNVVYFKNYIQKLVITKCSPLGYAGAPCHAVAVPGEDDTSPMGNKNIRLLTYEDIKTQIEKSDNDFWSEIDDDNMPKEGKLSATEKTLIKKWIDAGYPENECNDCAQKEYKSFDESVATLLYLNCSGCHNGSTNSGTISFFNPDPDSSSQINKSKLQDSIFFGNITAAISRNSNPMPKLADKLYECEYNALLAWKKAGFP